MLDKREQTILGQQIGLESENEVQANLQSLKDSGVIADFSKADPLDDKAGVDFIIWIRHCKRLVMLPLQVKTSRDYAKKHIKKYGPEIPVVWTKKRPCDKTVQNQLIAIINQKKLWIEKKIRKGKL
jgi:hypothetical protein